MQLPLYTAKEEWLNCVTHAVGAVISIIGVIYLLFNTTKYNDVYLLIGMIVFGITLINVYTASAIYHGVPFKRFNLKRRLRLFDHLAIYLMIGGTATPFALGNLRNENGFYMVLVIWVLAIAGMIFKTAIRNVLDKYVKWDALLYLAIAFSSLFFINPLVKCVNHEGIKWLALGGVFYVVGTLMYLIKKIPYNHAIWHLFVMAASTCHYLAILNYVTPPANIPQ